MDYSNVPLELWNIEVFLTLQKLKTIAIRRQRYCPFHDLEICQLLRILKSLKDITQIWKWTSLFKSTQTTVRNEKAKNNGIWSQNYLETNHFLFKQLMCWHKPYVIHTKKAQNSFFQAFSSIGRRSSSERSNMKSETISN